MATLEPRIWLPLVVLTTAAIGMGIYRYGVDTQENPFKDKYITQKGQDLPTIWIYYNNSDVNARWWQDFGARSTRVLNMPFLNLCYKTIVEANKGHYKVEVITGLQDLAARLGGWQELPKGLQNPLATVETAELNWIRAEVLSRFGGVWVHPATICLKPFPLIGHEDVVFYGTDADESFAGPGGTAVPSMYVMGAGRAGHPVFEQWAQAAFERLEKQGGGTQIRGDPKWDFTAYAATCPQTLVFPNCELSRKKGGKRIQIEDLLSAGQEGRLPFTITSEAIYVPLPWPELYNRRMFGWFLRMSEEQILNSDLVIRDLFQTALSHGR